MGYLSAGEIEGRLEDRFGIVTTIPEGDADLASYELDSMGPFIGSKQSSSQLLAFPRSIAPDGSAASGGTVPDAILDAVALLAYHVSSDEGPAITSESVLDRSISYASPKIAQSIQRVDMLVLPYLLKMGQRAGGYGIVKREYGDGEEPPWYQ